MQSASDPPPLLTAQPLPFQLRIRRGAKGRWYTIESLNFARDSAKLVGAFAIGMAVCTFLGLAYAIVERPTSAPALAILFILSCVAAYGFRRPFSRTQVARVIQFLPRTGALRIGYLVNGREDPARTRTFPIEQAKIRLCPLNVHTLKDWHYWGIVLCVDDERVVLAADRSREKMHGYMDGLPKPLKKLVAPGEGPELTGSADIRLL